MELFIENTPYPGLRPFTKSESHIFFGRDDQIDKLLDKLKISHFVAVIGPSGCGKSSLVKAGLIPSLKTGFFLNKGSKWNVIETRPGDKPFYNLANAINNSFEKKNPVEASIAKLKRSPKGLIDVINSYEYSPNENFILIVDQFEELFRYKQNNNIDEVTAFIALLIEASVQRDTSFYVVITMRSDFLGDCSLFPGLPEILNDNQFLTPRLTREQTKEAIEGPAKVCGGNLTSQVVNTLLNDLGVDHDQLPILQHALMRMWNRAKLRAETKEEKILIDDDDYQTIGKLSDAITLHADEAYNMLNESEKKIAEIVFKRLTERNSQQKDVRHPAKIIDIAAVADVDIEEVIKVVDKFISAEFNFIISADDILQANSLIDIAHESIMRQWDRLKIWIKEEYEAANEYKRYLIDANSYYEGKGEPLRLIGLENALNWQSDQKPNNEWASRYSEKEDDYEKVEKYLVNSKNVEDNEKKQLKEREAEAQKAKRNFKLVLYGFVCVIIVAVSIIAYSNNKSLEIEKNINNAYVINAKADEIMKYNPSEALWLREYALTLIPQKQDSLIVQRIVNSYPFLTLNKTFIDGNKSNYGFTCIALADTNIVTGADDGRVSIWKSDNSQNKPEIEKYIPTKGSIYSIAFSKDGSQILVGSAGMIWLYNYSCTKSGTMLKLVDSVQQNGKTTILMFSNDHKYFLSACDPTPKVKIELDHKKHFSANGIAKLWAMTPDHHINKSSKFSTKYMSGKGPITCLAFSSNGSTIVMASAFDGFVKYLDTKSIVNNKNAKLISVDSFGKNNITITAAIFTPDDKKIILGSSQGLIISKNSNYRISKPLSNIQNTDKLSVFTLEQHGGISSLAFLEDNNHVIAGSNDSTASIFDLHYFSPITLQGHHASVLKVGYTSKNKILTFSVDHTIKSWRSQNMIDKLADFYMPNNAMKGVGFYDNNTIISIGIDKKVFTWNVDGKEKQYFESTKDPINKKYKQPPITSIVVSPNGKLYIKYNADLTLAIGSLNAKMNKFVCTPSKSSFHHKEITSAIFSSDGNRILTTSADSTARLWKKSGDTLITLNCSGPVNCAAFSHDGKNIITGTSDGKINLWTNNNNVWKSKNIIMSKVPANSSINSIAFSLNGGKFIVGYDNGYVGIINTNKSISEHIYKFDNLKKVAFSQDGGKFATANSNGIIKIWNSTNEQGHKPTNISSNETPELLATYYMGGTSNSINSINSIVFSPNGKYLLCYYGYKASLLNINKVPLDTAYISTISKYYMDDFSKSAKNITGISN